MVMVIEEEKWVAIYEAAAHFKTSHQKIRATIKKYDLEEKRDEMDRRKIIVRLSDLQRIFGRK
jgi:hypothetical protein